MALSQFVAEIYEDDFTAFIRNINRNILDNNGLQITETLRYGGSSVDDKSNTLVLNTTIRSRKDLTLTFFKLNIAVLFYFLLLLLLLLLLLFSFFIPRQIK